MLKFARLFIIALLAVACTKEPEPKPTTPLVIKTTNGDARFSVEVANTPEDLQTGLMYRTNLAFNSGMTFNIYPVRPTAMWMKNTKIPLDMLFVAPDGSISMIKENAQPMSEDLIISRDPVRAVIELNAGQVRRNQIKVGDKVTHMLLNSLLDTKTPGPEAEVEAEKAQATAQNTQPTADVPVPELKIEPKEVAPTIEAPKAETPKAPQPVAPTAAPKLPTPAPVAPKVPVPAPSM